MDVDLGECRHQTARQVEYDKADMAQTILDIIPKNPQVEHIPPQMEPATMEKHGGE
jgi:hypothetical protein